MFILYGVIDAPWDRKRWKRSEFPRGVAFPIGKLVRMEKKNYWNYWLHSRVLTPHEMVLMNKAVTSGSRFLELQNHFKEFA